MYYLDVIKSSQGVKLPLSTSASIKRCVSLSRAFCFFITISNNAAPPPENRPEHQAVRTSFLHVVTPLVR